MRHDTTSKTRSAELSPAIGQSTLLMLSVQVIVHSLSQESLSGSTTMLLKADHLKKRNAASSRRYKTPKRHAVMPVLYKAKQAIQPDKKMTHSAFSDLIVPGTHLCLVSHFSLKYLSNLIHVSKMASFSVQYS